MKSAKIIYLEKMLRFISSKLLEKYKPKVIGITGSIGKTSTKEAVMMALSGHFDVRGGEKNYNNEIGIPLTIIGERTGGSSVFGWARVLLKGLYAVVFNVKYPDILVLEMGVDRIGDMKYLLSFVSIDVAIVTDISGSHMEHFKTIGNIAREKWGIVDSLGEEGIAFVNTDNEEIKKKYEATRKDNQRVKSYGFFDGAEIKASDIAFSYKNKDFSGISFKLNYDGKTIPIWLPNVVAKHHIYAVLAGFCAGINFKINPIEIAKSIEEYHPPLGRMNVIDGAAGSIIIDDTYNASRMSTLAALDVLGDLKAKRKIVAMGDMLELGESSLEDHKFVIRKALNEADRVFIVGRRMEEAFNALRLEGEQRNKVDIFDNPTDAGSEIDKLLDMGDVVLVKGSQSMRMEKLIEEIMMKPADAEKVLCRQSKEWKSRPFIQV